MSTIAFDYYAYQINNIVDSIKNEISFYEKIPGPTMFPVAEYIDYLKLRITDRPEITTITNYDNSGNRYEIKKLNPDEYNKEIDVMMFRRPWSKLREFHKIMKIKEFVEKLPYDKDDEGKKLKPDAIHKNKEKIVEEITLGLRSKKFVKGKNEIIYDPQSMSITSISCLEKNEYGFYWIVFK